MDKLDKRRLEISRLKAYATNIEKEVSFLLQNLQWDPNITTEKRPMVTCQSDSNHRIPLDSRVTHETQCHLTKLGYRKDDTLLPDPADRDATTLVKFSKAEIAEIICTAATVDPLFKRGVGCQGPEPLTVERLQRVYTADERRAIHDAVVNAASFCHDLTDLELLSSNSDAKESQKKSRLEILAELRNMKRRRTKYRVAPKTRNYSDVLRDVIKTQMDAYGEATKTIIKTEYGPNVYVSQKVSNTISQNKLPHDAVIKLENGTSDSHSCSSQREALRERYRARSRERRYNDDRKAYRKDNLSHKKSDHSYDGSHQIEVSRDYGTEMSREKRHSNNEKHNDKYSSKETIRSHEKYQKKDDYRNRYADHSSRDRHHKTHKSRNVDLKPQLDIKQERASQESEPYTDYTWDQNRDRSRNKPSKEKSEKHKRHRPDIKQERHSLPEGSHYEETSRKRLRSKSRERNHRDIKKSHNKDKNSSKKYKESDNRERKYDYLPVRGIKQERESP